MKAQPKSEGKNSLHSSQKCAKVHLARSWMLADDRHSALVFPQGWIHTVLTDSLVTKGWEPSLHRPWVRLLWNAPQNKSKEFYPFHKNLSFYRTTWVIYHIGQWNHRPVMGLLLIFWFRSVTMETIHHPLLSSYSLLSKGLTSTVSSHFSFLCGEKKKVFTVGINRPMFCFWGLLNYHFNKSWEEIYEDFLGSRSLDTHKWSIMGS